jgi:LPS O-antigen subunit length determinant protein (WzzB/FepE family)
MQDNSRSNSDQEYIEIDLRALFSILWKRKISIIIFTSIFAVSSVFYALSIPNYYNSTALFNIIQDEQSGIDSLASQYGGLASMAGIDIPQTSTKDKASLVMQTIQSREFMKHLITFDGVLEGIIATKDFDKSSKKIVYDKNSFDSVSRKWVREVNYSFNQTPSYLEAHEEFIKNMLEVKQDRKSGFITVSIEHISPIFAFNLLEIIIEEVNKIIKDHDLKESTMAIDYLNEQASIISSTNLQKSINNLYESQLRKKMLANIRDEYIINVIDEPFVPEKKTGPTRSIICIIITLIGGILSVLYVLIDSLIFKKRKNI